MFLISKLFSKHMERILLHSLLSQFKVKLVLLFQMMIYLSKVHALCKKHNVSSFVMKSKLVLVETGRISGGMYPVSCVLGFQGNHAYVEPGTHGSTYGGNPLGCAVSIRALEIMEEEKLTERAEKLGHVLRKGLERFEESYDQVGQTNPREIIRLAPPLVISEEDIQKASPSSRKPSSNSQTLGKERR
ncbi:hypothetical protein EYC84_004509 [Monilinia fructicola]|uniref:Ornithine aminotransferase n=1 Tax=Monilinia fructicola TaxID=38448 RepID=A0A5M9K3H0_MONFR|nr:hypothetical protein EYC84_004509 [Monilinia fructicola]